MDLSIVIPVYRSAATLQTLTKRLMAVLDGMGMRYEIIFVDDGSPDDSWEVLQRIHATFPELIVVVQLMRNFGQHNALMCGFRHCRGRYIVTMDDDLQNPPEEIPTLLKAIQMQDLDLVYGSYGSKKHNSWRNVGSRVVNIFFRLVFRTSVTVTSFRVIRRSLLETIFSYNLNYTFIDGLLAWNTQRIAEVPVEHHPRADGRSGYSLAKLVTLAFNLFTNFSLLPLQVVSGLGVIAALSGFVLGVYFLILHYLTQITVPGYASLIVTILVLGGIQLLSLGVMGEYLGRLHLNVNRKPQYSERNVLAASLQEERPEERTESMTSRWESHV